MFFFFFFLFYSSSTRAWHFKNLAAFLFHPKIPFVCRLLFCKVLLFSSFCLVYQCHACFINAGQKAHCFSILNGLAVMNIHPNFGSCPCPYHHIYPVEASFVHDFPLSVVSSCPAFSLVSCVFGHVCFSFLRLIYPSLHCLSWVFFFFFFFSCSFDSTMDVINNSFLVLIASNSLAWLCQ